MMMIIGYDDEYDDDKYDDANDDYGDYGRGGCSCGWH